MDSTPEQSLWHFFREVHQAVANGRQRAASPPYRSGAHIITARAGDVELTIKDISEEDAVLIAEELRHLGVRTTIYGSKICPSCGKRVPDQSYCIRCRARLDANPLHPEVE